MAATTDIRPEQSVELLAELHILTRDRRLNQDSRRKLKQVNHLLQFIEPLLDEVAMAGKAPIVVDHGAGKSYLGFLLYDLCFKAGNADHIYGVEARPELVERSRQLAARFGFTRMSFLALQAHEAAGSACLPERVDLVTALHACDTATDDAIRFALDRQACFIVVVPCCQAEVAALLRKKKNESFARTALSELWRHPLHTREFGSLVTNVLRCLQLEAHGYQLTVTELVGWEHALKNELIIARRSNVARGNARERIEQILHDLNLRELRERFLC